MIAPAPIKSSTAGRKLPSSQRSPAGMMAMRGPYLIAAKATARQFLKHPTKVGVEPVPKLSVAPLGEGSTSRASLGRWANDAGEREYLSTSRLKSASSALTAAA